MLSQGFMFITDFCTVQPPWPRHSLLEKSWAGGKSTRDLPADFTQKMHFSSGPHLFPACSQPHILLTTTCWVGPLGSGCCGGHVSLDCCGPNPTPLLIGVADLCPWCCHLPCSCVDVCSLAAQN